MSKQNSKPRSNQRRQNRGNKPKESSNNPNALKVMNGTLDSKGRDNDPSYYYFDARLAEQSSQLSFQEILGPAETFGQPVPTIMTIALNPSPGNSYDWQGPAADEWEGSDFNQTTPIPPYAGGPSARAKSGINVALSKFFAMINTFTGRISSYQAGDIGVMLLEEGEIASIIEHLRRVFGVLFTYNPRNRDLPLNLINALGVDAADLVSNAPAYRMRLNTLITRINQIPLLDNVAYIRKCRDIYQHIYVDSASNMAQIYALVPGSTWLLDESGSTWTEGTRLQTVVLPNGYGIPYGSGTPDTMALWLNRLETMIDNMLNSATFNTIYADIWNMATKFNVPTWKFDYVMENYIVLPEVNENFMLQLHNAVPFGNPELVNFYTTKDQMLNDVVHTAQNDVYVDQYGDIIYNPSFSPLALGFSATNKTGNVSAGQNFDQTRWNTALIDCLSDNPSLEDRIEMTRFVATWPGAWIAPLTSPDDHWHLEGVDVPDHYVTVCSVFNSNKEMAHIDKKIQFTNSNGLGSNAAYTDSLVIEPFDWAPVLGLNRKPFADKTVRNDWDPYTIGDLNYFTKVPFEYMLRLNRVVYSGLWEFRA